MIAESVNTDPVNSPVKSSRATVVDQIADLKKDAARKAGSKDRNKDRKASITSVKATNVPEQGTGPVHSPIDAQEPPPETPIGLDLRSPLTSEPSAARPESRDTPPPPDLTSASDSVNATARPSRRPRGSVSYAEPSLNTKMRRPTKELVDAVTGEGRNQRTSNIKHERAISESEIPGSAINKEKLRTVIIKKEVEADQSWKNLPSAPSSQHQKIRAEAVSPLGTKVGTAPEVLPSSIMTQRGRRTSALHQTKPYPDTSEPESNEKPIASSASAAAISALIAGSKKISREKNRRKDDVGLDEALEKLDIYDFQDSLSPADLGGVAKVSKDALAKERAKRRQSTLVAPVQASSSEIATEDEGHQNGGITKDGSSRVGRRRETLGSASSNGSDPTVEETELNQGPNPAKSVIGLKGDGEGSLRAERAASRRRSMMV